MKKLIVISLAVVYLLSFAACSNKTIGKISGAENECITIADVKYILDTDNNYSVADKGNYLGTVSNANITMRVYSVKGDEDGSYIYALWDWEGAFYKRQEA